MKLYMPSKVFFDPISLQYELGKNLRSFFAQKGIDTTVASVRSIHRMADEKDFRGKQVLLVTVNRSKKLDVCKPSADYEFSITFNCPGFCEYCYLQSTKSHKPYLKVFVNTDEILDGLAQYLAQEPDRVITFEAASHGDPLGLEHLTGSLAKTIEFIGRQEKGRLRVVTKYSNVDSLLGLDHRGHTRFRFSVNAAHVLQQYEHNTASLNDRLEAAVKIAKAGYPLGFIVAPIMVFDGWADSYRLLMDTIKAELGSERELSFELIQHRFSPLSKENILRMHPNTTLDLNEENRVLKYGKFGNVKYVYPKEVSKEIKDVLVSLIHERFPRGVVEYFT